MVCCFASFVDGWASYNRQTVNRFARLQKWFPRYLVTDIFVQSEAKEKWKMQKSCLMKYVF